MDIVEFGFKLGVGLALGWQVVAAAGWVVRRLVGVGAAALRPYAPTSGPTGGRMDAR